MSRRFDDTTTRLPDDPPPEGHLTPAEGMCGKGRAGRNDGDRLANSQQIPKSLQLSGCFRRHARRSRPTGRRLDDTTTLRQLGHPLGFVDFLDVFNPMGCLVFSTIGIIVFLLNPVRLLVSFGYHCSADARLKEGNIKKAKELVSQCHKVNAALFGIFAIVWLVILKAYDII